VLVCGVGIAQRQVRPLTKIVPDVDLEEVAETADHHAARKPRPYSGVNLSRGSPFLWSRRSTYRFGTSGAKNRTPAAECNFPAHPTV
jgi:hypothetical protein